MSTFILIIITALTNKWNYHAIDAITYTYLPKSVESGATRLIQSKAFQLLKPICTENIPIRSLCLALLSFKSLLVF